MSVAIRKSWAAPDITIDPEFRSLIPPLSPEELRQLERNIIADGCRDPLVVWLVDNCVDVELGNYKCYGTPGECNLQAGDGVWTCRSCGYNPLPMESERILVDGHNRLEICNRLDLPFDFIDMEFVSRSEARLWIRGNQKGRRNLTPAWMIELELGCKADLLEIGREKMAAGGGDKKSDAAKSGLSANDKPDIPAINTQKEIAKAAGVSTGQVGMAEQVKKKAPDLWEKAKAGDVSIFSAYKEMQREEKKATRAEMIEQQKRDIETGAVALPAGVFEVVAMDPPWNYGRQYDPATSRVANPYPEMPQTDLLAMQPPFANDSVLFLWTTHAFIWDAKDLMDSWGFTYKATIVWDKEKIGMGAWLRMQCEFCLVGIKGNPTWDNTKWRDIIRESRREHSRKPETFYRMVEEITAGRRLDYFSREQRLGWEAFGNDKTKF